MYSTIRYFPEREFRQLNPPCERTQMEPEFLRRLDRARHRAGIPFVLLSAFRTRQHELSRGRDGTSSHVKGIAVDIRATNNYERFKIVQALIAEGFTRIGVYETFIHVDSDVDKVQNVMWYV